MDADFKHVGGDAAFGQELVIGHEHQGRIELEPTLDTMEGREIALQEAGLQLAIVAEALSFSVRPGVRARDLGALRELWKVGKLELADG